MGKWWVLFAMCLVTVMLAVDATAVNLAIPVIAHDFTASLSAMQWVINAFFLLAAMVQIIGGHLGDSYGHKKLFLFNIFLFILSSLGVGLAVNEGMMIAFRALQGATIGLCTPATIVLIFKSFPKEEQSFARSFVVATMGIFLAAGGPIGGVFVHTIGWRWIFFINVPIGLFAFILAWKYCLSDKDLSKKPLDLRGTFLLVVALFAITFGLNQVQNWSFASPIFWAFMVGGVVFFYLLYLSERMREERVVDFRLFKIRNFLLNNGIRVIVAIIFLSILFFLPLYIQNALGKSPFITGALMLFMTVIMAILSPFAGKWVDRSGDKLPNLFSMILFLVLSVLFLFVGGTPDYLLLGAALFLSGIAIGVTYISTTTGALSLIPEKKMGAATGIFFTLAWMSCALGVAVTGTAIAMKSKPYLLSHLKEARIQLSPENLEMAERVSRGISPVTVLKELPTYGQVRQICADAFAEGIHGTAEVLIVLSVIGVVLSLLLVRRNPVS